MDKSCKTCKYEIGIHERCMGCVDEKWNWEPKSKEKKTRTLTLNDYQQATARTDSHTSTKEALTNFALGIAGEAGEIVDIVKKLIFHGHSTDKDKIKYELGDQLWYIARMAARFNLTLEEIAQANIDKLKQRYPDGFDKEKSINREEKE